MKESYCFKKQTLKIQFLVFAEGKHTSSVLKLRCSGYVDSSTTVKDTARLHKTSIMGKEKWCR